MGKRKIPDKLRKIAEVRSKKARVDVATARVRVRETRDDLQALDDSQAAHEAEVLPDGEGAPVDAAALQLLGLGRQAYRARRDETTEELGRREDTLATERVTQRVRMNELRGKERLYAHFLAQDRSEADRREQEELDDRTGSAPAGPATEPE